MPIEVVGFLQNAWSPLYAGAAWPRLSWLQALQRSRSGQRLRVLERTAVDVNFWWDNTTPHVADTSDGILPADIAHIQNVLDVHTPDVVMTFGEQARIAVAPLWRGPILCLPHPAYRVVTNTLYETAAYSLREGRRLRFIQQRGAIVIEEVPKYDLRNVRKRPGPYLPAQPDTRRRRRV